MLHASFIHASLPNASLTLSRAQVPQLQQQRAHNNINKNSNNNEDFFGLDSQDNESEQDEENTQADSNTRTHDKHTVYHLEFCEQTHNFTLVLTSHMHVRVTGYVIQGKTHRHVWGDNHVVFHALAIERQVCV